MEKFNKIVKLIIFIIFSMTVFSEEKIQILYLNSYSPNFPTFPDQLEGLKENFSEEKYHIQIEFLDTKRHPSGEVHKLIEESIIEKLKMKFDFSAVVTSDDNALHFVEKYYDEFFDKSPVVFFGVNNEKFAEEMSKKPNITGLVEGISIESNLRLIDKLYENRKLYFVSDDSQTGKIELERVVDDIKKNDYSFDFELIDLRKLSWTEFVRKLKSIDNEPLLLLAAYKDKNNETKIFQDSLEIVIKNYNGPIFHFWKYGVEKGMLGGNIIDHTIYGEEASKLIVDILNGSNIDKLELSKGQNTYLINYEIMKSFHLKKRDFPSATRYIKQPENLLVKYKYYFIYILIFFIITYVIVGYLVFQIKLRIKVEKQLIKSKEKFKNSRDELRKIIDAIPAHIYIKDINSKFLMLNKLTASEFNLSPEKVEGKMQCDLEKNCEEIDDMLKQDRDIITGKIDRFEMKDNTLTFDGKVEYYDTVKIPFRTMTGIDSVLGISINTTEKTLMQKELEKKNLELIERKIEIINTQKEIIEKLGNIIEHRSKETANHIKRVAKFSRLLAEKLEIDSEKIDVLEAASPMHDVGKIAISEEILHKPDKLNEEEFRIIKTHSYIGYKLLEGSKREILQTAAIIAYEHHERWDGTGYPQKKSKEQIHIFARITSIADVFDALISERSYKDAWPIEKAFKYLKDQSEKMFDPNLVNLFLNSEEEVKKIIIEYS